MGGQGMHGLQVAGSPERIIVFTRVGEPGKVKTRLIPALGARGAAWLHRAMAQRVFGAVQTCARKRRGEVEARLEGRDTQGAVSAFDGECISRPQGSGDLGLRMHEAFATAFREGARSVVLIGTDIPEIDATHLEGAFDALRRSDVVLGPASDGGYYLIGMRSPCPEVFQGIQWSTPTVCAQTRKAIAKQRLTCADIATLHDVDSPEDLSVWTRVCGATPIGRISVIVAALNEEESVEDALARPLSTEGVETILVDGGSTDRTREIASALGAKVCESPPGRARQLNLGAAKAANDVLLFLHADSRLPEDFDDHVREVLSHRHVAAGAFEYKADRERRFGATVTRLINSRSRVLQMPYGDQGIFLRRETFDRAGGFPELPIMEDFEFVRRLKRLGRVEIAPAPVITSGRRWDKVGIVRTTVVNQVMIAGYLVGVSPGRLAELYRGRGMYR
jgi:uncharacterized protein